jgi:phosphopantetheine--protein transferase-like protein
MDVVDVRDVEESVACFGDRYLQRVFTSRELAACGNGRDTRRLASCFAAKEATMKTISVDDEPFDWRSIDVRLTPSGGASVELSGQSAESAVGTGIVSISVSVGSTGSHAAAVALAEGTGGPKRTHQGVSELADDADLYAAGMTSHASVNLMLGLENEFDVEFPDRLLRRSVFESVASIREALFELTGQEAAA